MGTSYGVVRGGVPLDSCGESAASVVPCEKEQALKAGDSELYYRVLCIQIQIYKTVV